MNLGLDQELWTAKMARARLEEAGDCMRRLRASSFTWPREFGSHWPDVVRDTWDAYGYDEAEAQAPVPTGRAIDRMDKAIEWIAWIGAEAEVQRLVLRHYHARDDAERAVVHRRPESGTSRYNPAAMREATGETMAPSDTSAAADTYAGDVDVTQAWEMLSQDSESVLVDCRTEPEWTFVGVPDLSSLGKETVFVVLNEYPLMGVNPLFGDAVRSKGVTPDKTVLFICRSGQRSRTAAIMLTALGYEKCFNVLGGFEGPHDGEKHRGAVDGWKKHGLPWVQK